MTTTDPDARRLLWFLFAGSRGGENRIRIIDLLKERPYNTNQLAEAMGLDYKAIQHHMGVLEKNSMVVRQGEKYGVLYFISNYLEHNIAAFEEVKAAIERKKKAGSGKKY
ncbi:MAG: transcriptional regulator [Nitrososphaera sp.]